MMATTVFRPASSRCRTYNIRYQRNIGVSEAVTGNQLLCSRRETLYRQCCLDLHAVVNFLSLAVRHEAPANPNAAGGNMDVAAQPIWPWPPIASTNCNIKTNKPRLPHQRNRPNAAVD